MAITAIHAQQLYALEWRIAATSSIAGATFYWYVGGLLSYTTQVGRITLRVSPEEVETVEVFDDPSDSPQESYSGRATIQWDRWPRADYWTVEKYTGSAWSKVSSVKSTPSSVAEIKTEFLADMQTHTYRVTPVGNGNSGTPREFAFPVVRIPNRLTISAFAYNAQTGQLTATVQ